MQKNKRYTQEKGENKFKGDKNQKISGKGIRVLKYYLNINLPQEEKTFLER
jgi:hypothetical protein